MCLYLVIGLGPRSFVAYEAFIQMFAWQLMCVYYCNWAPRAVMAWPRSRQGYGSTPTFRRP
jgi:hypothetical protein